MEAQISESTFKTSSVSGRTMKMLLTLVPLTLICLLLHVSAGPLSPKMMQDKDRCCKGFNGTLIPKKLIKNVRKTFCDMEAILITTKKDKMFCYDPSLTWAQKRLSDFHKAHKSISVLV
ncbi:C-C motif chemokine 8 [Pleuronectes platessa]|uniref:C-C motif chemokine 8 n=1 Tax=Pleuronectes platessa TaxID=8262 RepID=UPI00232A19FB|nr:C-C motif chemokine 8 [Pleuronectes platessa]